jgi:hypothetical protein
MDDRFWERGGSPERTERTDWDDVADLITDEGARVFARGEDRRDWTLDQWIDWGVETVRDAPIFHPPHWQVVVAEAFVELITALLACTKEPGKTLIMPALPLIGERIESKES